MSLVNKLLLLLVMGVVPLVIGGIPISAFVKKEKFIIKNIIKLLIEAWVYGSISMLAVMQLIAVPMIALNKTFSKLVSIYTMIIIVMVILGVMCWIWNLTRMLKTHDNNEHVGMDKGKCVRIFILSLIAVILVGIQVRVSSKYEHLDDDDSRFIALELNAIELDSLFRKSPINGNNMYWNVGEVKKDYTSPWTLYVATISKWTGIHPAILSHRMLPMLLIPLCHAVFLLLGLHLYKDEWEHAILFICFINVIFLFGYTSTRTIASLLLLRSWQGKAVFACLMIPAQWVLLWELYDNPNLIGVKLLLAVCCEASCLLSGSGVIMSLIMVGAYGLVELARHKKVLNTISIWATAIPCVIYGACNIFWFEIFYRI